MIVSDPTTLIALINIDAFSLLELFVDSTIIPREVYDEICRKPHAKTCLDNEIEAGFVSVGSYKNEALYKEIRYILDSGESAAITMAIERKLPLIIDERKGRRFAQRQGVEIIGLVGILRFLWIQERVSREKIASVVEKLNSSDFRISPKILAWVLSSSKQNL